MDAEYWHRRWREGRIGFHEGRVSARLVRRWPALGLAPGDGALVPLCGKAHDLAWLAGRGHPVLGVELSELAVADFFREQGLEPAVEPCGPFAAWRAGRITLLCGDWFALDRATAERAAGAPLRGW